MQHMRFVFSYDGTRYHGWQRQPNAKTVQEVLENTLSRISNLRITLVSSGRTDAGVHARVQVAHAGLPEKTAANPRLMQALNSMLPPDIRVLDAQKAAPEFHALRDVEQKMYLYFISTGEVQPPALASYSWHLRLPLDWQAMDKATQYLRGTHDFKAFAAADHSAKTTRRTLFEARWVDSSAPAFGCDARLRVFRVVGSGFLKQMVRSLVGTLVWIGSGKAKPEHVRDLLQSRERTEVGPTAPPHGLWLWDILYK